MQPIEEIKLKHPGGNFFVVTAKDKIYGLAVKKIDDKFLLVCTPFKAIHEQYTTVVLNLALFCRAQGWEKFLDVTKTARKISLPSDAECAKYIVENPLSPARAHKRLTRSRVTEMTAVSPLCFSFGEQGENKKE